MRNGFGLKTVYQCLVLTGEYVIGDKSYIEPPLRVPQVFTFTSGSSDRYDSVVDNPVDPSIFVVFKDTQAYPEYLITFK